MKKKTTILGAVIVLLMIVCICILNKPVSLGNIKQSFSEEATSVSNISFTGENGDRINFSFQSNIEHGNLDIVLYDSEGTVVYELDKAKELETFYVFEKTDTYTLQVQYIDFVGNYKITVYEVD